MAEVIKHSLISGGSLFDKIRQGNWKWDAPSGQPSLPLLQDLVAQAIQVKIQIVQDDPFEKGRRAVLNLGHTFAHAIEQASRHAIYHGEAVAMGIVAAANLSARLGHCPPDLQASIAAVLADVSLPCRIPKTIAPQAVIQAMQRDKKKKAGRLRIVLMRGIGDVFLSEDVPPAMVLETLSELTDA
jgi:3-dehydroquinate synthetase